MRLLRWRRRVATLGAALLVGTVLAVVGPASLAQAVGPPCQSGGVLLVFARGANAGLAPWSGEADRFFTKVREALGSIPSVVVQVGDEEGDGGIEGHPEPNGLGWDGVDPDEYPAVSWSAWADGGGLNLNGYNNSRETGTNNLVGFLTQRDCPQEAIVLGGYSQGADVVGAALPRLPNAVIPRIAHVALYADPRFNGITANADGCWRPQWVKGDVPCKDSASFGVLGPRNPYVPAAFESRTTSWCDDGDKVCIGDLPGTIAGGGTHGTIYASQWITESAPTIAHAAWLKTIELNPQPANPPPPNVNPAPGAGQKLAATKNQDGRLALFYVGGDSAVYYQYQLNPGGWWGAEKRIAAYAKGIAATTSLDGRIELFYVGGDNAIYHRYQTVANSDSWSAEERFNVGALGISAARNGAGRIELVIIGMNRALYIVEQQAPSSWTGGAMNGSEWQHIPSWAGDVAMTTASDGRNEIFYVGSTGVLMHRWQGAVGDSYPHEEGFSANIVKLAATRNQDGRLEVFSVGTNAHLYNKWQWQPNTPWYHTWDQRVGQARYLTAARNHDGRLELFHVGLNNRIYHQWQNNPGAGQGWSTESLMYGSAAP